MAKTREEILLDLSIKGTTELVKLRGEIDKTERSLKALKKQSKQNKETTDRQVQGLDHLERKLKLQRQQYRGAQKALQGLNQTQKRGTSFTMKMAKAFSVAQIATDLFTKAMRAIGQAVKQAVVTFKDFEFQMAKVKAISGANEREFKKLINSAKQLGRTTFFTATQVGELQLNLSKLGFNPQEILNAQEAILKLSTAMGEDLGRTATVVAATIRGFGVDTDQTGRFADAMAAAFANSALDIEKFQTSMSKVSAIASMAGFSFEETTGLLALLTDRGIEASIAGTSLRNILLHLQDGSSDLSQKLGRTVHSGEDFIVALKELKASGIDVAGVMQIVDRRQVQAMNSFIASADSLTDFNKIMNTSSGSGDRMADIMENTLGGALLKLKSAYEGLILTFEDGDGVLQKTVQNVANFLNILSDNFQTVEQRGDKIINKTVKELQDKFKELSKSEENFEGTLSGMMFHRRGRMERRIEDAKEDRRIFEEENKFLIKIGNRTAVKTLKRMDDEIKGKENAVKKLGILASEQFEKEQNQEELDRKAAEEKKKRQLEELELQKSLINIQNDKLEQAKALPETTEAELVEKNKIIQAIETEIKRLKELGIEKEKQGLNEGQLAEIELNQILSNEKLKFAEGIIKTEKELNSELLRLTIEHTESVLSTTQLSVEQRASLETKLADLKAKQRKQDLKDTEESEKAKSDLIKANIDNAMTIGSSLTQIGQLMGKNTAAAKAGMAITKAASVASAIKGIIDAKGAITKQAKDGDPFSAFARMAIMAAAVAPLIASLLALKGEAGGSGGAGDVQRASTNAEGTATFARGGLTRGGVFQGASHANGGVKFAVGGRVMEAEGGEAIINKKSTSAFRPILSAINSFNGNGVKFADGGLISSGERFALGGELRSIQNIVSNNTGTSQVIVVESEVTTTQNRVSALESQASF